MPIKETKDFKFNLGNFKSGALGKITDVPGVSVGHALTNDGGACAGVTVIMPCPDNIYANKCYASSFFMKCVGKSVGLSLVRENGVIEAPIGFTSTENVSVVQEVLSNYVKLRCKAENCDVGKINTVVCECTDNEVNTRPANILTEKHVLAAISSAGTDFAEGNTGAGSSAVTYGLSGGIGSASRILQFDGKDYTVGVITMSNYGVLNELVAGGRPLGSELASKHGKASRKGTSSCATVLATDIPFTSRQLGRILRSSSVAITRMGGETDCETYVAFTTAGHVSSNDSSDFFNMRALNESLIDRVICAVADAIEESVLRSMLFAGNAVASDGTVLKCLSELL